MSSGQYNFDMKPQEVRTYDDGESDCNTYYSSEEEDDVYRYEEEEHPNYEEEYDVTYHEQIHDNGIRDQENTKVVYKKVDTSITYINP